jgi:hypothetical protein
MATYRIDAHLRHRIISMHEDDKSVQEIIDVLGVTVSYILSLKNI